MDRLPTPRATLRCWGLLVALLVAALVPAPLHAQTPTPTPTVDWREQRTTHFAILFAAGAEQEAARYAAFADTVYGELTRLFDHPLQTPITLRLYPSLATYETINPLARDLPGVVAHAQFSRREVAVLVPRTAGLTEEEIVNNVRHEITHLIASDLSTNRLPVGLQEGIAQYVERPGRQMEEKVALLREARARDQLLTWSQLNAGTTAYERPEIGYPQAASIVAFLIDRYGFPRFRDFLLALREAAGYRSALQQAYGIPADALEAQWAEWLPDYLAGRWRVNAIWAYDITPLEALVAAGAYSSAERQIEEAIALLQTTDQPEALASLLRLRDRARQGQGASATIRTAREALSSGDYSSAAAQIAAARATLAAIGDSRHERELRELEAWAIEGAAALQRLGAAQAAANRLDHGSARALARSAGTTLAELGHPTGPAAARALLARIEAREQGAALGLLGSGLLALLTNLLLRWRDRRQMQLAGGSL